MSRAPDVTLLLPNRDNASTLDLVLDRLREHTTYPSFELSQDGKPFTAL